MRQDHEKRVRDLGKPQHSERQHHQGNSMYGPVFG